MKGEFILAGCSVSSGVPTIGNDWGVCDPNEPRNVRDRPCAVMRTEDTTLIIDTGPDFRKQMNDLNIAEFDAVLYTHTHSDHIQGIDELRTVRNAMKRLIDVYSNQQTIDTLKLRFDYMFSDSQNYGKVIEPHVIGNDHYNKPMTIGDIEFTPYYQDHGDCDCMGFRFGNMAYSADMHNLAADAIETIKGVDVWLADGAGYHIENHPTHAPLTRLYQLNEEIQAKKVYVTGLSKFMDYKTLKDELPAGFEPAYDGLTLPVEL